MDHLKITPLPDGRGGDHWTMQMVEDTRLGKVYIQCRFCLEYSYMVDVLKAMMRPIWLRGKWNPLAVVWATLLAARKASFFSHHIRKCG